MTPADLAQQQLEAAWVSAIAAGVQAVGAIGAIVAAVVLGRQSAKREEAARLASVERERRADEAAERRARDAANLERQAAEAAERRARDADEAADRRVREADEAARRRSGEEEAARAERDRLGRNVRYNETVDRAVELGSRCAELAAENAAYWERLAGAGDRTNYGQGSLSTPELRDVIGTLSEVAELAPPDPDLRAALASLLRELKPKDGVDRTFGPADKQARASRGMELAWRASVARLRALRRDTGGAQVS